MSNTREGFSEIKKVKNKTKFAIEDDGAEVSEMGTWKDRHYTYAEEQKQLVRENPITLSDVLHVPSLRWNLYSITKGITGGGTLSNEKNIIISKSPNNTLRFDYKLGTKNGHVMAAVIKPTDITVGDTDNLEEMDINTFHKLTHECENIMKYSATRMGYRLTGKLKPCVHCAKHKAKKKI